MCNRWHVKGDYYDNCPCATSHVSKENTPAEKRANLLTFMKKCREVAKKNDWLIGSESSSVQPPEKPPSKIPPLPFKFKFCPTRLNYSTTTRHIGVFLGPYIPSTPPHIIPTCLGGCCPSIWCVGTGCKAQCGALGGHFRRRRPHGRLWLGWSLLAVGG